MLGADDSQDLARATALIQSHVPHAFLRDSRPGELVYGLPRDTDRARFGALFRALEHNLPCLRLTGFGISDTTLEEVRTDGWTDGRMDGQACWLGGREAVHCVRAPVECGRAL